MKKSNTSKTQSSFLDPDEDKDDGDRRASSASVLLYSPDEPPATRAFIPPPGSQSSGSSKRRRCHSATGGDPSQCRPRSTNNDHRRHYGASAMLRDFPCSQRSRSPSPVLAPAFSVSRGSQSSNSNNNSPGNLLLPPPEIKLDEALSTSSPNSPPPGAFPGGNSFFSRSGSLNHLCTENKAVMVKPDGSLLAVNEYPLEFRESMLSIPYQSISDEGEEVSLMYARHEKIPMKDFSAEIRASLDVENFLHQAQLMLDVQETNVEAILNCMLRHLLSKEEPPTALDEAKKSVFTHDSVHQLGKTIQSTCSTYGGGFDYDQSWICVLCTAPSVQKRHVAIARLRNPANFGRTSQEVWFIVLIVTPTREKGTKNALETGRTFSTLFADMDLRLRLLTVRTEDEFKRLLWEHTLELAEEQSNPDRKMSKVSEICPPDGFSVDQKMHCWFARGLRADFKRRLPYYLSDYKDGVCGHNTIQKTISTIFFLYFACILPAIALGVLNYNNTDGYIDVKKVLYSQTIGGIIFALFGGQPMVILITTAPLALYTKVIYNICEMWNLDFAAMFSCTGLWNSFFLLVYAVTDASRLMKWSTKSTEEIFALFMSVTFAVDAFKDISHDFSENYYSPNCDRSSHITLNNVSMQGTEIMTTQEMMTKATDDVHHTTPVHECLRENSILYTLLMLGTVWLGLSLYNFTKTPFLNASKRGLLADCALPVSVLVMSFMGSYIFRDVKLKRFELIEGDVLKPTSFLSLNFLPVLAAMGLGFCLSILFFMDQNISGAMVNSPENRLKKGPAYNWDLMIVALLNAVLAFFGLPMIHGALPHSPLHVRAMADVEDRVDQGHVYQRIIYVRETRITGILAHVLIGLSLLFINQLKLIPRPVLDGLFLYLAITALHHNQLFERIMLLVTEQAAYLPNHYIRTVPQRKVHLFTMLQLVQLAVLCAFGFAPVPYMKMVFPVLLLVLIPIRHKLVPYIIHRKFLQALDAH